MKVIDLIFAILLISFQLTAATVNWDGEAGTDNWSEPKNWDTDALPQMTDDVFIDGAFMVTLDINTTVQSVLLLSGSELYIPASFQLSLTGVQSQAMYIDNSELKIDGNLTINSYVGHGIFITKTGSLSTNGTICITGTAQGKGVINLGIFDSDGTIKISNIDSSGIYNEGEFSHGGTLDINWTKVGDEHGIENNGSFEIVLGGHISIDSILGSNGFGVINHEAFTNRGDLLIYYARTGIVNEKSLNNHGLIKIDSSGLYGIQDKGATTNHPSGRIEIFNIDFLYGSGIYKQSGQLTNLGFMRIHNCDAMGITNEGIISNMDSLILFDCTSIMFVNEDTLYNYGVLYIDSARQFSYGIENTGLLENYGKISISKMNQQGIYNLSFGLFKNYDSLLLADCSIAINNVSDSIINKSTGYISITNGMAAIFGETPSTYVNEGKIHIDNLSGHGIIVSGWFINTTGADITGTNIQGIKLSTTTGGFYMAEFVNNGKLSLE